jgi:Osmosensitive K+ channel histidine kinase
MIPRLDIVSRLQDLMDRLQVDISRATLGVWIAIINVAIVLLVVGGISISAVGLLRDLADQQGKSRVQLAGALAREDLRRFMEDALTEARSIADRQTFQRLLTDGNTATLEPFLRRSCTSEIFAACAVFEGSTLIAKAGAELPWSAIATAAEEQGERFMAVSPSAPHPVLGAVAPLGGDARRLFVVRLMDEKMSALLSERVEHEIRILNYLRLLEDPRVTEFTRLHSAGLSDGRSAVMRIDDPDLYAASFPIFASTGEAIALLEARLPTRDMDATAGSLIRRLLTTAIVLAALAVLAGVLLGQQVTLPVSRLTEAAERLGEGDFSTSIPVGGTKEVGKLGRTMEDMRNNLIEITGSLRRSEAEAQAVLSGIVEGVFAVDRSRVIRYLNPQAARLLGVAPHDAIGRFCGDVLRPCLETGQRPCETRCPILRARAEGNAQATEYLELRNGSARTTVVTSAAPVDEWQVQVIRDETELESVRRARDSVLANISHEFRTPLAAQLASIELLRDGLESMPKDEQKELVLSLERGTLRLTRLIDNLLESVRIESGQLSIRRQSVALDEIVEDANALIGALLTQRRQRLLLELPEDLPRLEGDGPRLTQVLVNLLANASKFAPEDSAITVGAKQDGERILFWVEDEGPGVPEIEAGSIFERFQRGRDEEPEPGGLGLGLWIVKSIVDRHGGTITAKRTSENKTRFEVALPLRAANDTVTE